MRGVDGSSVLVNKDIFSVNWTILICLVLVKLQTCICRTELYRYSFFELEFRLEVADRLLNHTASLPVGYMKIDCPVDLATGTSPSRTKLRDYLAVTPYTRRYFADFTTVSYNPPRLGDFASYETLVNFIFRQIINSECDSLF